MQRREQEVAGPIPREDATGAIRTVCTWSQPNDEDGCGGVPEAGDRSSPVLLGSKRAPLGSSHVLAPLDEPGAHTTVSQSRVEILKGVNRSAHPGYCSTRVTR